MIRSVLLCQVEALQLYSSQARDKSAMLVRRDFGDPLKVPARPVEPPAQRS